jgi:ABC-type antimicrobial peptide transport system ATPase subunit
MQVVFAFMQISSRDSAGQHLANAAPPRMAFGRVNQLFQLGRLHVVKLLHALGSVEHRDVAAQQHLHQ